MALDRNSPTAPRMVLARVRDRKALKMRCAGKHYSEIAVAVGYKTGAGAYKAVYRALKRVEAEITQAAKTLRAQEVARIDELTAAIWQRAVGISDETGLPVSQPDLAAIDRVVDLMKRRAQLLGLDVHKLELSGTGGGPIDICTEREQVNSLLDRIATGIEAIKTDGEFER